MRYLIFSLALLLSLNSCILLPMPERKPDEEKVRLKEIFNLSDEKVYREAIEKCRDFMDQFPESHYYDVVLLKLGEAFEGLLDVSYYQPISDGEPEEEVKKAFLERYGSYQCWVESPCGLKYNLSCYREMMERFPDSPWADEADYHLIPWACDYGGLPDVPLEEIGYLEKILQKYPTSSLKGEIYYKIAYRFQVLYEVYSFSPKETLRDREKAGDYKRKAAYFYKMALKQPVQTNYSKKAWNGLNSLEAGKRIYILE